ncbi:MAG: 50S ribosomal protein L6 [Patescibacteria group bacterium]
MSRIGKQQYDIPEKTEISLADNFVIVKGPLGELKRKLRPEIKVEITDRKVQVNPTEDTPFSRALWGTYASHITNMIEGVNKPYEKQLILEGVGFKSEVKGNKLVLALGFSHLVEYTIPSDLKITAEKNLITISGIDKEKVGAFASKVRKKKKAEPYKGKGFRYVGEVIRRKQGKKNV